MPVKAGVGASTVAAHVSWAAAQNPEARVLLVDFDRYSGITAFQFNVDTDYTVQDALNNSMELDEDSWRTLVRSVKNVDLLVSRPGELTETDTERHIAPMMKFAQRNYTAIHADLPDTFDAHSLSVLRQADQIYIVTTSELPSLRLAKLKVETLRKLELEGRTHWYSIVKTTVWVYPRRRSRRWSGWRSTRASPATTKALASRCTKPSLRQK